MAKDNLPVVDVPRTHADLEAMGVYDALRGEVVVPCCGVTLSASETQFKRLMAKYGDVWPIDAAIMEAVQRAVDETLKQHGFSGILKGEVFETA